MGGSLCIQIHKNAPTCICTNEHTLTHTLILVHMRVHVHIHSFSILCKSVAVRPLEYSKLIRMITCIG